MSCGLEAALLGDTSAEQLEIVLSPVVECAAAAAAALANEVLVSGERGANALTDVHWEVAPAEPMGTEEAEGLALAEEVESTGLSTGKMLLSGV